MKTAITLIILFIMNVLYQPATAQISIDSGSSSEMKIEDLRAKKTAIEEKEKQALKEEVERIETRLEQEEITNDEAENLKLEAAKLHALNIEDQLNIIDSKIALLQRNETKDFHFSISVFEDDEKELVDSIPSRTTSSPFIAFGLNNTISESGGLDDSPYKVGGSRFFEIGYEFTTSLTDFVRVKYGLSFQFNGLKPENNHFFVQQGDETVLVEHSLNLDKSKFRNDNLVMPIHFEFGKSEIVQGNRKAYYSTENKFKFGAGGYVGLNINTVQKLKYEENGRREKVKLKRSYNTTNFIYGLSAYVGYDWYSLYFKYDLNPVFTDNAVSENNISLGVRLAF